MYSNTNLTVYSTHQYTFNSLQYKPIQIKQFTDVLKYKLNNLQYTAIQIKQFTVQTNNTH